MDYVIRDAQVKDARALAEIYTLAWQFAYEGAEREGNGVPKDLQMLRHLDSVAVED